MAIEGRDTGTTLQDSIATAVALERAFTVHAKPNPLKHEIVTTSVREGTTLADMVKGLDASLLEITVNGEVVPYEYWPRLKPKAGATVSVRTFPQGKTVRKIVAIVVIIVVIWFVWEYIPEALASGSITAGQAALYTSVAMAVGQLAISALVKPTLPKQASSDKAGDTDRASSITGTSNAFTPFGVQPCVIGEIRFFPPNCALPYTEMFGDDQYLRMLLDLGPGDLTVSEVNIGDDDIATFTDVEYQFGPAPSLYSNDIYQLPVSVNLNTDNTPTQEAPVRTASNAIDEISVEVAWPQGLFAVNKEGKDLMTQQTFDVEFRPVGTPTWISAATVAGLTLSHASVTVSGGSFVCTSSARKMIRCGIRWPTPSKTTQYEVRVRRDATEYETSFAAKVFGFAKPEAHVEDFTWVGMSSIRHSLPSTLTSTKFALRIKATDQLNGTVSTLNLRVQQNIKYWTGSAWAYGPSNNPAWLYLWLLTVCPANPRLMDESRIDVEELKAWGIFCDAMGLQYANVIDAQSTLFEVLQDICAAGRASFTVRDGLYGVVRDVQQTTPVQVFTPRNSWDFSGQRVFTDELHALKCSFLNQQAGWQKDERMVYQVGFDASNATNIEPMDMRGMITPESVWRLGSYHLSVVLNRQNTYQFKCDFENLICQRGDLILVSHPVCNWGSGWGRVKTVNSTTNVTSLTLDEDVSLKPFEDNVIRIRREDGTTVLSSIKTSNLITNNTITYSRASEATYRGFDGRLAYAKADQARYAYGPAAEELGVLIEQDSTNLCKWSELLSDPSYTYSAAGLDYTGGVAPDGYTLAMRLLDNSTNALHFMGQSIALGSSAARDMTFSVFVKANGGINFARLRVADLANANASHQVFDLTNGVLGVQTDTGTAVNFLGAQIEPWPDGWYRVSLTVHCTTAANVAVNIYTQNGNNFNPYAGTGGQGLLVWGLQLETLLLPTSYIPTKGAAITRQADVASMPSSARTGVFVAEFTPKTRTITVPTVYSTAFCVSDDSLTNRYHVTYRHNTNGIELGVVTSNVSVAQISVSGMAAKTYRAAVLLADNNMRMSVNGSAIVTDTSATTGPSMHTLQFGNLLGASFLNGYLRSLVYLPGTATDATLIQYSTPGYQFDEDTISCLTGLGIVLEGDLAIAGVRNEESGRMIVTKVEPSKDLTATITCVDEAPDVYTAGTGTPPGFISTITNQPWCPRPLPPVITAAITTGFGNGPGGGLHGNHGDGGGIHTPGIRLTMRAQVQSAPAVPGGPGTIIESTGFAYGRCFTDIQGDTASSGSTGTAAGTGDVVGRAAQKQTTSIAVATGASVNGLASIIIASRGTAAGSSTAQDNAGGTSTIGATGTAAGMATASAPSDIVRGALGTIAGSTLASAIASAFKTSTGSSAGTAVVTGAGIGVTPGTIVEAVGTSSPGYLPTALVPFDGPDQSTTITDYSGRVWTPHGTMRIDHGVPDPWGGSLGSLLCEGTGNGGYLSTPNTADIDLSNGDWTIDYAFYPGTVTAFQEHVDIRPNSLSQGLTISQPAAAPDKILFQCGDSDTTAFEVSLQSSASLVLNTWAWIRVVRSGSTFYLYLNGALQTTQVWAGTINIGGALMQLGANRTNSGWVLGRYSNFRVTERALSTGSSYVLPTAPFAYRGISVDGFGEDAAQAITTVGADGSAAGSVAVSGVGEAVVFDPNLTNESGTSLTNESGTGLQANP